MFVCKPAFQNKVQIQAASAETAGKMTNSFSIKAAFYFLTFQLAASRRSPMKSL